MSSKAYDKFGRDIVGMGRCVSHHGFAMGQDALVPLDKPIFLVQHRSDGSVSAANVDLVWGELGEHYILDRPLYSG